MTLGETGSRFGVAERIPEPRLLKARAESSDWEGGGAFFFQNSQFTICHPNANPACRFSLTFPNDVIA